MGDEVREWAGFVATVLAIVGAILGFWGFRRELRNEHLERIEKERELEQTRSRERNEQLRLNEVADWARSSVSVLQRVSLLTSGYPYPDHERDSLIRELGLRASELVEIGRLYFRNDTRDGYGQSKPSAYRGYRPRILDYLVACHEICRDWQQSSEPVRRDLAAAAQVVEREFVSLIRDEVGRVGTRVPETGQPGDGSLLAQILRRQRAR